MGEPKSEVPPQVNGGVKQKPTTLNLASGTSFYRPNIANGRATSLNDHYHHQKQQKQQFLQTDGSIELNGYSRSASISRLKSAITGISNAVESNRSQLSAAFPILSGLQAKSPLPTSIPSWNPDDGDYEDRRDSPPPPTPLSSHPATPSTLCRTDPNLSDHAVHQASGNNGILQPPGINQLSARSPNHNGFSLYTPPAPIPATTNKGRSVPNGLPQPAPRRPHSIAASPYNLAAIQSITAAFAGRNASAATAAAAVTTPGSGPQNLQGSQVSKGPQGPQEQPSHNGDASETIGATSYPWQSVNGISPVTPSRSDAITNGTITPGSGVLSSDQRLCRRSGDIGPVTAQILALSEAQQQRQQQQHKTIANVASATFRSAVPPQSLWNGQHQPQSQQSQPQHLPARRPHSIASTPVATTANSSPSSSSVSSVSSAASGAVSATTTGSTQVNGIHQQTVTNGTRSRDQWGASNMVLHQPVARRPYSSTLPHPRSPTLPAKATVLNNAMTNSNNCNTWSSGGSLKARPHSIASTPQGNGISAVASDSPADSGYRSLPSASSDYQLSSKSTSLQQAQAQSPASSQNQSAVRRLSLPSAQNSLRINGLRPSPTFHGLPSKPFTCGVSPNGNPIFLGCTHLHGSTGNTNSNSSATSSTASLRSATPATSPASMINTAQAIQQLLASYAKNGIKIDDDKLDLFIDILDSQERFAKVSLSLVSSIMLRKRW
ncbi:hypothetical protein QAD02_015398 [Eretmocerus hayati]|uniref:Uncharacterized protein n=1 Tax=Eretmocerus hayati TaxID=131215 RepID=A0ACC2P854_9HYME|nr:hypothetical protein QAD02_015398 [Eretmocerus hayati]